MLERSSDADTLQMDGICVSAAARGKGVGSALFDALFGYALEQGYSYITLDVIDTNPRAKHLYERLGFEKVKTESTSILRPILGFSHAIKMRRAL
jgi:ribosomal protein S18 acetylase RimI-like enzyme